MFTKIKLAVIFTAVVIGFAWFISAAEAATAVTIEVTAGPAKTEAKLLKIELYVPERPAKAKPLKVGDKIFFKALETLLEGEGKILKIYDTKDLNVKRAIILDHVTYE